jgi:hypothetical protein
MKNKTPIIGLFLSLVLGTSLAQGEERRGFYLDAGIGIGSVSYGDELDDILDEADDNGLDRITAGLTISIGGAVLQNLYLVGTITGLGDRLYDGSDYLQLNTYLYGVGVRYYPLRSRKHLQIGADVGIGKVALQTSEPGYDDQYSDNGTAVKLSVAWDFDSTLRGPHVLVGAEVLSASIDHENVTGAALFVKFVLK